MNTSIIMPVYNAEKTVFETVKSIVNQTFSDFEFIIVDDFSSDNTVKIIESFKDDRIKIIKNTENKGVIYSLNTALKNAKGRYVFRMDADDIAHSDRFEKQLDFIKRHSDCSLVGTLVREFGDSHDLYNFDTDPERIKINLLFFNTICHPSVLFDRKKIKKEDLIYYDHAYLCEDFELFSRISRSLNIYNYPDTLLMYRIHTNQILKKHTKEQLKNAIIVSQNNLKNIFGTLAPHHIEASEIILKAICGLSSKSAQRSSILKTFDDLLKINKKKKMFNEEILKEKQIYFISMFDKISK